MLTVLKGKKIRTNNAESKPFCVGYSKMKEKVFRKGASHGQSRGEDEEKAGKESSRGMQQDTEKVLSGPVSGPWGHEGSKTFKLCRVFQP